MLLHLLSLILYLISCAHINFLINVMIITSNLNYYSPSFLYVWLFCYFYSEVNKAFTFLQICLLRSSCILSQVVVYFWVGFCLEFVLFCLSPCLLDFCSLNIFFLNQYLGEQNQVSTSMYFCNCLRLSNGSIQSSNFS